ncbi:MAG TPA: cation:proton antiporter [bacterium]|nr:cation:proton antiporter [bacterium]
MNESFLFLQDLALVLCVGAVTTLLFHWLKQPTVLGYLLAGLLVGPHVPLPLLAHEGTVRTLSELGVILVMFSIGLEFSIPRFLKVLPTAGLTAVIEISLMAWLGYMAARLLGWSPMESLFAGAIVSLPSTMVATKALADRYPNPQLDRVIVGILVVQDFVSVLLLAVLTPLAEGAKLSLSGLLMTCGSLIGFLGLLFGLGYLIIPRFIRAMVAQRNSETLLVATVGLCFAMALLAREGGYSVALGAFLAGMLVAESGAIHTIGRLIHPLRDMFAAVFFVSVGMLVDPAVLREHWGSVLLFSGLVVGGQILTVSVGTFLSGKPLKTALQAAMALTQIGEFSFIIAQIGVSHGVVRGFLYDVTVAVAVVTAFTTPLLLRAAEPFSRFVDSHLPKPLQTFTALYGSWLDEIRNEGEGGKTVWRRTRRMAWRLVLDTFILAVVIITTSATIQHWIPWLVSHWGFPGQWAKMILATTGLVLSLPFFLGVVRTARTMGGLIAAAAVRPSHEGELDLGLAPRRALTLALQLGIVFAVGFPLLALTQPFLPFGYSPLIFFILLTVLGVVFWKSAVNLQDHLRAGAQMVAEALSHRAPINQEVLLEEINTMAPGIGAPTSMRMEPGCPSIGKRLGDLNLRLLTGASIIAINRGEERILMPSGKETLQVGDNLVLVGSQEAVFLAKGLLRNPTGSVAVKASGGPPPSSDRPSGQ